MGTAIVSQSYFVNWNVCLRILMSPLGKKLNMIMPGPIPLWGALNVSYTVTEVIFTSLPKSRREPNYNGENLIM